MLPPFITTCLWWLYQLITPYLNAICGMHWLDFFYFHLYSRFYLYFADGWSADPSHSFLADYARLSEEKKAMSSEELCKDRRVYLSHVQTLSDNIEMLHGEFQSPLEHLSGNVAVVHFRVLIPRASPYDPHRPCVLLLPGTGDAGFERRVQTLALPLARQGIASCVLEIAYYGHRAPPGQVGTQIRTVADLMRMGMSCILEARFLTEWLVSRGLGPIVVSGMSMGGSSSQLTAATTRLPVGLVSVLPQHAGTVVFLEGCMQHTVTWAALQRDPSIKRIFGVEHQATFDDAKSVASFRTTRPRPSANRRSRELRTHSLSQRECRSIFKFFTDCTDVSRFSPPKLPDAVIFLAGKDDGYVPAYSPTRLHHMWPGSSLRWMDAGHVSTFLFEMHRCHAAIVECVHTLLANPLATQSVAHTDFDWASASLRDYVDHLGGIVTPIDLPDASSTTSQ